MAEHSAQIENISKELAELDLQIKNEEKNSAELLQKLAALETQKEAL